jgi:hypothetical protein
LLSVAFFIAWHQREKVKDLLEATHQRLFEGRKCQETAQRQADKE